MGPASLLARVEGPASSASADEAWWRRRESNPEPPILASALHLFKDTHGFTPDVLRLRVVHGLGRLRLDGSKNVGV